MSTVLHRRARSVLVLLVFALALTTLSFAPKATYAQECKASVSRLDVTFLIDQSGSMEPVISRVRSEATNIVNQIRGFVPDSAFAVASFNDYSIPGSAGYGSPGDVPYTLQTNITADIGQLQTALNAVQLQNGGDFPEAYARALDEMPGIAWRPDARRVVVLFGDAIPHTPNTSLGDGRPDPGRDGKVGTADDITFEAAVANVKNAGITVVALNSQNIASTRERVQRAFEYVTSNTGGATALLGSGDVTPFVVSLVTGALCPEEVVAKKPALVWIAARPTPNLSGARNEIMSFEVVAKNMGEGSARDAEVVFPYDGAVLEVVDATFESSRSWVSVVNPDSVVFRTGSLGPGSMVKGVIRFRIRNDAPADAVVSGRLQLLWADGVRGGKSLSNLFNVAAQGPARNSPTYSMTVEPATGAPKSRFAFSSGIFVPNEPVGVWYNLPDGRVVAMKTYYARPDGSLAVEFDSKDLPAGDYSMVFNGHWSEFTTVAPFAIR